MTVQNITKMSMNDIYMQLKNKLESSEYGYAYVYDVDMDKGVCYASVWGDGREFYAYNFTLNGSFVEVDTDSRREVVPTTVWQEKPEEPVTMNKMKAFFKNFFQTQKEDTLVPVIKQFDEEEMIAVEKLFIVPNTFDAHEHTISDDDTEVMVKSFSDSLTSGKLKFSLFHTHETNTFKTLRAWINPIDCMIGETFVPRGQPLCENKFLNKAAWEDRKTNGLAGVSIGCRAKLVDVEDAE